MRNFLGRLDRKMGCAAISTHTRNIRWDRNTHNTRNYEADNHTHAMHMLTTILLLAFGLLGFALCFRCIKWFEKI